MPLVALAQLRLDEVRPGRSGDLLQEAAAQLAEQGLLAPDKARLQKAGADRHVGLGLADAVVERARGMADLQAEIPQRVEHVLDHLLAARRLLVGQHEQEIDIRFRRELAAAIAAIGDDRHLLARRRVRHRIDLLGRDVIDHADELIDQETIALYRQRAALVELEPAADLHPARIKRLAIESEHRLGALALRQVAVEHRDRRRMELRPVDNCPSIMQPQHGYLMLRQAWNARKTEGFRLAEDTANRFKR